MLAPLDRSLEIGRGELAELKAQRHDQEATMARPTELAKYRWDPKLREWWDRMQQQPPKAHEPEKPMEQMTIPDADRPMMTRTAWRRRLAAEKHVEQRISVRVQELPGDPGRAR